MSPDRFSKLFEAYQDGTLNGADARELHDALEASPELLKTMLDEVGTAQALAQLMRKESAAIAPGVMAALRRETQKVALRDRVMSRLKTQTSSPIQRRKSSRRTYRPARRKMEVSPLWAIGAAACVLLALGLALTSKQPATSRPEVAREIPNLRMPEESDIARIRARVDEADRRRMAIEADLLQIQKQQAELAPNVEPTRIESPRPASDDNRSRVLAELDERRRAAQKELELANHQRHEATQLLAAQHDEKTPARPVQKETKQLGKIAYAAPESVLIRNGIREPAMMGNAVHEGDQFETSNGSSERKAALGLTLFNGAAVDLSEATSFKILDAGNAELQRGLLYASVEKDTSASYKAGEYKWVIRTPSASVGILGTRFDLHAEKAETRVQMEEGTVSFFNGRGSQAVGAFKSSTARTGARPSQPAPFATESLWRGRLEPLRRLSVDMFTLADCDTAKAILGFARIGEKAEIRLSALNTRNFTLVARTYPEEIGSITFSVNGTLQQVESVFPYCISTDTDGRARPWNLKPGTYEIIATPYTGLNATGTSGQPLKATLKVLE